MRVAIRCIMHTSRSLVVGSLFALMGGALLVGCFAAPAYTPPTAYAATAPKQGPTHAATTDAQWTELEARAKNAVVKDDAKLVASGRMTSTSLAAGSPCMAPNIGAICADTTVKVEANHCYDVAIAWSYDAKVRGDFAMNKTNDSLGGTGFDGAGGNGKGSFCADHDGDVRVSATAITPQGAMAIGELHEYAFAVSGHVETAKQTAARRANEGARADASVATMENNIYMSEARKYGEAFAKGCERCRKQHGTREQFEVCAQSMGMDRDGRVLCQGPVR
jgi:hypothetical protein